MQKNKRNRFSIWLGCILASASILFLVAFRDNDFRLIKSLDIYYAVFKEVIQNYADDNDPEKLAHIGIDAMLNSLDPYTNYFNEEESKAMKQMHTGRYGGIGATIMQFENKTIIADLIEDCPAQKSGLKQGDILIAVDSTKIRKQTVNEIGLLLKGDANTSVNLTIERQGETKIICIKRKTISIPSVPYFGMVSDSIGYIKLTGFSTDASKDVKNALKSLTKNKTLSGIILDLRGNPGGLLNEAVDINNLFIDKGQMIVSLRRRNTIKLFEYKTSHFAFDTEIPLAVIVNDESASASEVVSGSIQDLDRGVIVGEKSFGKGLVQTELPMPYKGFLNITTSKYYTPSGRCIQAIDYFNKDKNGTAPLIADSLRKSFTTSNGRKVLDGGGITPDIIVKRDTFSSFIKELFLSNMFFLYANKYAFDNKYITSPKLFEISDIDFNNFIKFTLERKFHYSNPAEKQYNQLITSLKTSNQYDESKETLESLGKRIYTDNEKLFQENKKNICNLLKVEICSRFYYNKGEIEAYLSIDKELNEAIKILQDKKRYNFILNTKS